MDMKLLKLLLLSLFLLICSMPRLRAQESITLTLAPDHPATIRLKVVAEGDWSIEGVREPVVPTNKKTTYTPTGETIKLKGAIHELDCASAHLSALDLTSSSKLRKLDCSLNAISTLDLSAHKELSRLDCNSNALTTLSVDKNKKLTYLDCGRNRLQSLSLSCSSLEELNCGVNFLSELTLIACPSLSTVMCHRNKIHGMGMEHLIQNLPRSTSDGGVLVIIDTETKDEENVCTKEQVSRLKERGWDAYDWKGGNFEEYSGSEAVAPGEKEAIYLKTSKGIGDKISMIIDGSSDISCTGIKEAPVIQGQGATEYTITSSEITITGSQITLFSCTMGGLTESDFTHAPSLKSLNVSSNSLRALNLSAQRSLEMLHCGINQLTELDLSTLEGIQSVNCVQNAIAALDLSHNTKLNFLNCATNKLIGLQVEGESLKTLLCYGNRIKTLDLKGCPNLIRVEAFENDLTQLDVSLCQTLELLYCGTNRLTSLDLSNNTKLKELGCGNNLIEKLDLTRQRELSLLYVTDNRLGSLVLSPEATQLERVDCYHNQLSGQGMALLASSMPAVSTANFAEIYLYDSSLALEGNKVATEQIQALQAKGWTVYDQHGDDPVISASESIGVDSFQYSFDAVSGALSFTGARRDCRYDLFDMQGHLICFTVTNGAGVGSVCIPNFMTTCYILYGEGEAYKVSLANERL